MMTDKLNLDEEITSFRKKIDVAHKDLSDFEKRHLNGLREQAVIFCLRRAADISRGCVLSAESHLPNSVTVLTRALYETFIRCAWVVQNDENARRYNDAAVDIYNAKGLGKELKKRHRENSS